jgi:hypothetical protein
MDGLRSCVIWHPPPKGHGLYDGDLTGMWWVGRLRSCRCILFDTCRFVYCFYACICVGALILCHTTCSLALPTVRLGCEVGLCAGKKWSSPADSEASSYYWSYI